MPLNQSENEEIKSELREFGKYLKTTITEHQEIAAKFHEEKNKETFFHDGQVARAVSIYTRFQLRFKNKLVEKGGE
jgi:hypothetical protein